MTKRRKKHGLKILTLEEQQQLIEEMEPLSDLDAYEPRFSVQSVGDVEDCDTLKSG